MSSEGVSSLYLWGCGWDGRLGNGSSENELLPYEVFLMPPDQEPAG